jgi:exopolysaccharide biosynthesis operon protein EpsL
MLSSSRNLRPQSRPARAPVAARGGAVRVLGLLAGVLCCGGASAALSDTVHPFASLTYSHDDNLLRLPDGGAERDGPRGDNMTQLQGGVLFERPLGRQILSGQAKVSRVSFAHYDSLDYNGKDGAVALEWHLANHLSGNVGASYAQTLTPFSDYHTSERNLRVQRREYANGTWLFHPSWQLRAGFNRDRISYGLDALRYSARTERLAEFGVDYLASSGSKIGVVARRLSGRYPNQLVVGGGALDNGYDQDELKANVFWTLGGVTQIQMLAGWARRTHPFFTERDASGVNGRISAIWRPLPRLRLTAEGWREFSAVESNLLNSSLNKGASLAASWEVAAKVRADASLRRERRVFETTRALAILGQPSDSSRYATLGLQYLPLQQLQINASLFRETRQSDPLVGTGSYHANGVSLNVTAQF